MQGQNKPIVKKCLDRVELTNKPTLILTEEFKKKVDFLHNRVGAKEWSGELITREEGCITDLDAWKITCEDIFLVDVGSPGYTSYEVDKGSFKAPDIIELYEQFPGLLDGTLKAQHIHSHWGMKAFFSGTDWENLEDRANVSNYFLMLIVNFDGNYCAKVAYKGVQKGHSGVELEFANNVDGIEPLKLGGKANKDVLVVMDCKIVVENPEILVDDVFKARYEAVAEQQKKEEEEAEKKRKEGYKNNGGGVRGYKGDQLGTWKGGVFLPDAYSEGRWSQGMLGHQAEWWDNEEEDDTEWVKEKDVWIKRKKPKKDKKISEMTDKEWEKHNRGEFGNEGGVKVEKFDIRHAKAFLNSVLYGTYMPDNFNDCISKIEADHKKLANAAQVENYIEDFDDMLQEHFDVIWPNGTIAQYTELLESVREYLFPYAYNKLVKEMLAAIEMEISVTSNVI